MVSNIIDDWSHKFPEKWPQFHPPQQVLISEVSRTEFEELRKEVLELKKLLEAAKKFDAATGQPDCEMEEKTKLLKELAKLLGIDLTLQGQSKTTTTTKNKT